MRHATAEQLDALRESVEELARVSEGNTASGFLEAKAKFYRILLEGAGNPVAADMLRAIHTRVSQLRATSLSDPMRAKASLSEIREFVQALAMRNEEAAWNLCVHHIQNAANAALKMLTRVRDGEDGLEPFAAPRAAGTSHRRRIAGQ